LEDHEPAETVAALHRVGDGRDDRGAAEPAGDHHEVAPLRLAQGPAAPVRSAQAEPVAGCELRQHAGNPAHRANGVIEDLTLGRVRGD
jgi:hypothetical protein